MPAAKRKPAPAGDLEKSTKKTKLSSTGAPAANSTSKDKTLEANAKPSSRKADPVRNSKKDKNTSTKVEPTTSTAVLPESNGAVPVKKPTKARKAAPPETDAFAGFSDSDDGGPDDPREAAAAAVESALLAGFSSSESDSDDEEQKTAIKKIPSIPKSSLLESQLTAANTTKASDPERTPGTVYVSRIPHGFYEPQMKAYFGQFGVVSRLRLSRNKITGKPKHYAFIEFESAAVADIVARTMDKYLLFGHILQVRLMRDDEIHPELWKGAGRRFKAMPRAKLEAGRLARGKGREGWEKKVKQEEKKRRAKSKQLKELGYDFDMPAVRQVDTVPKKAEVVVEEVVVGETDPSKAEAVAEVDAPTGVGEDDVNAGTVVGEKAATKRPKGRKEKKVTKKARLSE